MSLNKKILAAAIAGLLVSTSASAITLGSTPRDYAIEHNKPLILTDAADNVTFPLSYNFSANEVRYGRYECSSNLTINNPVVTSGDTTKITVGAVNGAGTPALFFSLTATATPGATAAVTLDVAADNTLTDNNNVSCAFSIYDQPSQAQAGGTTGRIYTSGFATVIRSVPSFVFTTTPGQATADVEATNGAYTDFVVPPGTGVFGALQFGLVGAPPFRQDGAVITLADLFAASNNVTVTGDFSAAQAGGAGLQWNGVAANTRVGTNANFVIGGTARTGSLEYMENGVAAILESGYTATLNAVANAGFTVASVGPLNAGEIVRNGTQIQAPLVQTPQGWLSRIALTNDSNQVRAYTIRVIDEEGNSTTLNTSALSGNIAANRTKVISIDSIIASYTGNSRATIVVTVAAPDKQIQGLYQIVNPAQGSISNHVMVRPGTN